MKKIYNLFIFFFTFFLFSFPFEVNACPHYDENGDMYYLFPDEADYSITVVLYPKDFHAHSFYYNSSDGLLYEQFDFPLYQDYDYYSIDSNDSNPTVKGLDSVLVKSEKFSINVPVKKAFLNKDSLIKKDTFSLFYILKVKKYDDILYKNKYNKILKVFENEPVDLNNDLIYSFSSENLIRDKEWNKEIIDINSFPENIKITLNLDKEKYNLNNSGKLQVLRLDDLDKENVLITEIDSKVNSDVSKITFTSDKKGCYVVVLKNGDISSNVFVKNEIIEKKNNEKDNEINNKSGYIKKNKKSIDISIYVVLFIIVFVIGFFIFIFKGYFKH